MNNLPSKPRKGSACNGCGICCAIELCQAAEIAFAGSKAPCPALKLIPDGTRTYCELFMIEQFSKLPPMLENALGIGLGCSMDDE